MKRVIAFLLALALTISAIPLFSTPASAAANWPSLSSSSYCEFKATKNISCWRNSSCTTRGTRSPAKSYNAYISKNDVCKIIGITSSYIIVKYPTSSGERTAYIRRSDLIGVSAPTECVTSKGKATVYTNTSGTKYGSTAKNDKVYACGTSGSYTLVIYTAKSGSRAFKLGYVKTSDYNSIIKGSTSNTTSGWRMPMDNAYCTWRSYSNMSWGSYTNRSGDRDYHLGIDIYGTGGKVYAVSDGKVVACSSSASGANGRFIILQHTISGKTVYSFYAHLGSLKVSKGQTVSKGTQIGVAGGSGYGKNNYYGTHLHFAIVDTLWTSGGYYGYATWFSGNKVAYKGVTYYNPVYVINNNRLP